MFKDKVYLTSETPFYKGNIHMHTIFSDGCHEPKFATDQYKKKGFHFVCLSDHETYMDTTEFDTENFITIAGMEAGRMSKIKHKDPGYHFGCLKDYSVTGKIPNFNHLDKDDKYVICGDDYAPIQAKIDEYNDRGNLVILNHPEWHLTRFEDVLNLHGFHSIEIFNECTEFTASTSYATAYLDHALQNGVRLFAVAADDAHSQRDEDTYGGGYIMVNTDKLERRNITDGIKSGSYYSSMGPEIKHLEVRDGYLHVECSPCKFIMFKAFSERGDFLIAGKDEYFTSGKQKLCEEMTYIRVECIDDKGRVAWSNPIFAENF